MNTEVNMKKIKNRKEMENVNSEMQRRQLLEIQIESKVDFLS